MLEVGYLNEKGRLKVVPQEVQETIQGILNILDIKYGLDRQKYIDNGLHNEAEICVKAKAEFFKLKVKSIRKPNTGYIKIKKKDIILKWKTALRMIKT